MSQYTQQPQFPQAPVPAAQARNGLGTAALILGIIGALSGIVPFFFWLAGILGIIALIMGLAGRGRAKRGGATNKGVAMTGAILGLVSLILSVVGAVILFKAASDVVEELDKAASGSSASKEPGGSSETGGSAKGDGDKGKDSDTLAAGDSAVYDDKLTVTVSAPEPYSPGEYAVGHTKGNKAYKVTVVINNAGKEKFDAALVTAEARAGKEGVKAEEIIDDKVGELFTGTIMPGKKATVVYAFDTPADAKNLVVEISPDFSHDASQWDLKL